MSGHEIHKPCIALVTVYSWQKCARGSWVLGLMKLLPAPLAKFLVFTGILNHLSYFFSYGTRSLSEVVNNLTNDQDLRAVLCYVFGTYGRIHSYGINFKPVHDAHV